MAISTEEANSKITEEYCDAFASPKTVDIKDNSARQEPGMISDADQQSLKESLTKLSPKELLQTPNQDYFVQTPNRETYFVVTPSYYLRSNGKHKTETLDKNVIKQLHFNNTNNNNGDSVGTNVTSDIPAPHQNKFKHKPVRSKSLLVKSNSTLDSKNQNNPQQTILSSVVPKKKQRHDPNNNTKSDVLKLGSFSSSNTVSAKGKRAVSSVYQRKSATTKASLEVIQSVMKKCQTVRKSKQFRNTPLKAHCAVTRSANQTDTSNGGLAVNKTDKRSSQVLGKRKISGIDKVTSANRLPNNLNSAENPVSKRAKVVKANASFPKPIRRSVRFAANDKSSAIAENRQSNTSISYPKTVLKRKSAASMDVNNVKVLQEHEELASFKAQPVPRSVYNKPIFTKKSLNLTIPKSPMFSSKYALRRKSTAEKGNTGLQKFYPTPKFSAVFKPKLSSVKTKFQPFSFDVKDKERLQRRSQKLQEIGKPEVVPLNFKAQPVPANVFHAAPLPCKQVKRPTKVAPFQLRSRERAASRTTEAPLTTEERECQKLSTFKANRNYEKIIKGKPWKPTIAHQPTTQAHGFVFQSEKRAKEREILKKNKSARHTNNKENNVQQKSEFKKKESGKVRPLARRSKDKM